jgi:predicted Zn-dependent protease with MMP-like domain/Flp pilus assembly protein TadD
MKDKDRYWDCLDQAMEASHSGRTDEALAWLDEALKADPSGAEAHNGRGEILWDDGRIHESLYEFERAIQADPKFVAAHLNRAELLIEELGEYEQAIELSDALLGGKSELPRLDRATEAEVLYIKSKALFYLDDLEGALFMVLRALKTGGEQSIYRAFEGQILFELGRFAEARERLERAVMLDADSAHAAYHLGLVLERLDAGEEAETAFARADALDPDHYALPTRIDDEAFARVVRESIDNLPRSFREHVEHVPVLVEDFPSVELITRENLSPQILGLFLGVPRTEASRTEQPADLDRVLLFKRNLEKVCRDEAELTEQIQITVRHEIGHYLGLDEDDMERLGLA